ncbi:MAG: hypothetical protein GVY36_17770 [Verrucomicrobia bacterium]|jgi:predicted small secreted protein|nr:hypothetical protein [Verrucomicrobiota bacterium]
MMKKTLLLLFLPISAMIVAGCDGGTARMAPKETNVLGIAKHEKSNYQPTGPATFAVSTDELYTRKNFQGSKTSLLWGLVTLKDY